MVSGRVVSFRLPQELVDIIGEAGINKREVFLQGLSEVMKDCPVLNNIRVRKLEKEKNRIRDELVGKLTDIDNEIIMIKEGYEKFSSRILSLVEPFCEHIQSRCRNTGRMDWATSPYSYIEHMTNREPRVVIDWFEDHHGIRITYGQLYDLIERRTLGGVVA